MRVINEQDVFDIIDDLRDRMTVEGYCAMVERVKALPSATCGNLEKPEIPQYSEGEAADCNLDCISRQAAIDALCTPHGILYPIRTIEELPSAQQDCAECHEYDNETKSCPKYCDVIRGTVEEVKEPTFEQIKEYCHRRCLTIITNDLYHDLITAYSAQPERTGRWSGLWSEPQDDNSIYGEKLMEGDTIYLLGVEGVVKQEYGAWGWASVKYVPWEKLEEKMPHGNRPDFCYCDNFVSFWELKWAFDDGSDWDGVPFIRHGARMEGES